MAQLSAQASTEIDATADALWPIVADVAAWAEWQGTLGAVTVEARDGDGRVTRAEAIFDAKVQKIRTVLAFDYEQPARLSFEQVDGSLKRIAGAWRLEALDGGRTRASYELEVEAGGMLGLLLTDAVVERMRGLLVEPRPDELKARAAGG